MAETQGKGEEVGKGEAGHAARRGAWPLLYEVQLLASLYIHKQPLFLKERARQRAVSHGVVTMSCSETVLRQMA